MLVFLSLAAERQPFLIGPSNLLLCWCAFVCARGARAHLRVAVWAHAPQKPSVHSELAWLTDQFWAEASGIRSLSTSSLPLLSLLILTQWISFYSCKSLLFLPSADFCLVPPFIHMFPSIIALLPKKGRKKKKTHRVHNTESVWTIKFLSRTQAQSSSSSSSCWILL